MGFIYSYKMTYDDGFAPNPYHGFMTLATCKPDMRQKRDIGDWIAGWTANRLLKASPGDEKLIYLMRVSEKMTLDEYFLDPRFKNKIPKMNSKNIENRRGDNIYEFLGTGAPDEIASWKQHVNCCHNGDFPDDIKGKFVLIAKEFYYFGSEPLEVQGSYRPNVGDAQARYGVKTCEEKRITDFVEFVNREYAKLGRMPRPYGWDRAVGDNCNSSSGI